MATAIKEASLPTDSKDQPPVRWCTVSHVSLDPRDTLTGVQVLQESAGRAASLSLTRFSTPSAESTKPRQKQADEDGQDRLSLRRGSRPSRSSRLRCHLVLVGTSRTVKHPKLQQRRQRPVWGSGNSTKAVSFVDVPTFSRDLTTMALCRCGARASSASPFFSTNTFSAHRWSQPPHPVHADPSVSYFDAKDSKSAPDEDSMDVDPSRNSVRGRRRPRRRGEGPSLDERFITRQPRLSRVQCELGRRHRGSGEAWRRFQYLLSWICLCASRLYYEWLDAADRWQNEQVSTTGIGRRTSPYPAIPIVSGTSVPRPSGHNKRNGAARTVSPCRTCTRRSRTFSKACAHSACPSSRVSGQYVFVHRAIIHHFLAMLADEDVDRQPTGPARAASAAHVPGRRGRPGI